MQKLLQFDGFNMIFLISDDSNTDDHGAFKEFLIKLIEKSLAPSLVLGLLFATFSLAAGEQKQVLIFLSVISLFIHFEQFLFSYFSRRLLLKISVSH